MKRYRFKIDAPYCFKKGDVLEASDGVFYYLGEILDPSEYPDIFELIPEHADDWVPVYNGGTLVRYDCTCGLSKSICDHHVWEQRENLIFKDTWCENCGARWADVFLHTNCVTGKVNGWMVNDNSEYLSNKIWGRSQVEDMIEVDKAANQELSDKIDHPSHYTGNGKAIECADYIESHKMGFFQGNAIKYLTRFRFKGTPIEDLEKCEWYINRLKEIELKKRVVNEKGAV